MFLSFGSVDIGAELRSINAKLGAIVTSIAQVRQDYRDYAQQLKDQRDAALALAESNAAKAQENADALAAFQADDAATDASQLADKEAADAQAFADDLAELKRADEPVEPDVPAEPAGPTDVPAEGGDSASPGDVGTNG
ncbi:MAG: hypothetical protein JO214_15680 [Frankiaceae bacterium]|nr:hypothetical protein [Frankiaceae bacterium]